MQKFLDVLSSMRSGLSVDDGRLGVSGRRFRRCRDRYEEDVFEGVRDGRLGKPSAKRMAAKEKDRVLRL